MDRLCDEVIQIILNELGDPASFSQISQRYHRFTRDPYVRSSYFLSRYGRIQALYWALGKGKLMNEQVIDIMLSSGAHLSRYLVQCAIHHYFRSQVPFIKAPWVRTMSLSVFTHFMIAAARIFGDIPVAKGEDDGSIFTLIVDSVRFPTSARPWKWENLKAVVEKYKFIPFCHQDPMMVQFPLVLAIEPRLLPYARANGFHMDRKYRNFIFRKMFEKQPVQFDGLVDEIVQNVLELSRLDPHMFLTRTVAAEVCMEAHTNEPGYAALRKLDNEGSLRFKLTSVVEALSKLFVNTRSVASTNTFQVLRRLQRDYPSHDPTVRLVLLCTIFFPDSISLPQSLHATSETSPALKVYVSTCHSRVDSMGLDPVTRSDLFELLINKFTPDSFVGVLEFGRVVVGLNKAEMDTLVEEVAFTCLEIGCKGKMLRRLVATYPNLKDDIAAYVLRTFRLNMEDLPPSEDEKACSAFEARLCRDFIAFRRPGSPPVVDEPNRGAAMAAAHDLQEHGTGGQVDEHEEISDDEEVFMISAEQPTACDEDLGYVGQDTLTVMIRKDESSLSRRRRFYEMITTYSDSVGKLTYPADYVQVGRWITGQYGPRSAVTAVFMLHAVLNENAFVLQPSLYTEQFGSSVRVPVTLKHFKMLARLGRTPNSSLFDDIEAGTEFYFSEEDYLSQEEYTVVVPSGGKSRSCRVRVKSEYSNKMEDTSDPWSASPDPSTSKARSNGRGKKRPRRSVALVKTYAIPDSDDEEITEGKLDEQVKKRRSETNLQRWIKHLAVLLREEQKKHKEKKRRTQAAAEPGAKVRVFKSDFFKSLSTNLGRLRIVDREKRRQLYGADVLSEDYSEGEEDEYHLRTSKRRRVSQ
ncbi:uncharacterized protein LAESUDRAFT_720047 [Laetiporus sulphureus 93-53]|uniref:Uncharacterized protein n=1 Tax=Laetiporus sulphureus 93-53 TaxID=1314785 RepID=A0A165HR33_9APHY|nr:uncharacterized protein LAESUDRAFT_720047 [Laetiporus sulphureus 93-53]KZT12070.1 hypothetical protein LAESUDRAFT_720047 [Laetiporus sulphureus 93-53]